MQQCPYRGICLVDQLVLIPSASRSVFVPDNLPTPFLHPAVNLHSIGFAPNLKSSSRTSEYRLEADGPDLSAVHGIFQWCPARTSNRRDKLCNTTGSSLFYRPVARAKISDARSATARIAALTGPVVSVGRIDPSTTYSPDTPGTDRSGRTTASRSLPMRHVPTG